MPVARPNDVMLFDKAKDCLTQWECDEIHVGFCIYGAFDNWSIHMFGYRKHPFGWLLKLCDYYWTLFSIEWRDKNQ